MRIAHFMLVAVLVVTSLWSGGARAAETPEKGLTRAQASQLLDTLKDPEKRERFTATLEAFVKTLPAEGAAATPANTATAPPAAPAQPKAHGPSPLKEAFAWIQKATAQLGLDLQAVTNLPALRSWLASEVDSPQERSAFYQATLWIALILAITLGVQALVRWFIRHRLARSQNKSTPVTGAPRFGKHFHRLGLAFGVAISGALAGNTAIMLVADQPVARTIAFGLVNLCVVVPFVLAILEEFVHAEATAAPSSGSGSAGPLLPSGLRTLLITFLIVVAIQLLSRDISEELGAPNSVQEALAKCIALVAHVLAIVIVLVSRPTMSAWIRRRSRPGTYWAAVTDTIEAIWVPVSICAIAGSWLVWALGVPDAYREILRVIIATLVVLLVSRFVSVLLLKGLDRRMSGFSDAAVGTVGSRLFGYRNLARLILKVWLVAATLIALTEVWGLPSLAWLGVGHGGHRLAEFVLQLLVLAIVGIACWEAADLAFERRVKGLIDASSLSRATRLRTLQPIIRFALLVVIALLVIMTALNAIGINVGPLLAGASIVGVALGFGSQKLVQDFITGIFLLVEDAMDVGDNVTLAGVSGTVEHISIRTIRLRAGDGSTHLVPFSAVTSVNNTNRGLGNAAVSVSVDPSEDTDRVSAMLSEIALQMRQESAYSEGMQSDLQLWGVDKVDGSMVTIAGQIVCTDKARWAVQREFNRRMKLRFEQEKVKLAIPQQGLRIVRDPPHNEHPDHGGEERLLVNK